MELGLAAGNFAQVDVYFGGLSRFHKNLEWLAAGYVYRTWRTVCQRHFFAETSIRLNVYLIF